MKPKEKAILILRLDKDSPIDAHVQIFKQIREAIVTGVVRPGEQLPTNAEICKGLTVSARTVQRAYTDLASAGLCEGSKALGTVALEPPRQAVLETATDMLNDPIQKASSATRLTDDELVEVVMGIVRRSMVGRGGDRRKAVTSMTAGERRELQRRGK